MHLFFRDDKIGGNGPQSPPNAHQNPLQLSMEKLPRIPLSLFPDRERPKVAFRSAALSCFSPSQEKNPALAVLEIGSVDWLPATVAT